MIGLTDERRADCVDELSDLEGYLPDILSVHLSHNIRPRERRSAAVLDKEVGLYVAVHFCSPPSA